MGTRNIPYHSSAHELVSNNRNPSNMGTRNIPSTRANLWEQAWVDFDITAIRPPTWSAPARCIWRRLEEQRKRAGGKPLAGEDG
eukprot:7191852-Heterocapsa_arctica.AAC.1